MRSYFLLHFLRWPHSENETCQQRSWIFRTWIQFWKSTFSKSHFRNKIFALRATRDNAIIFMFIPEQAVGYADFQNFSTNDRDCNEHNGRSFYLSAFGVKFKWGSSVTSFWRVWKFVDILISCWLIHYEYAKNCTTVLTWKNKILTLFILYPNLYTKV